MSSSQTVAFIVPRPFSKGLGEYSGSLKDGERHGWGKVVFPDGKTLVGEFKNGGFHNGVYKNEDGSVIANGEFSGGSSIMDGFVSGWATYRMDSSTITGYPTPGYKEYEGEFKDGQEHGKGTITYGEDGESWNFKLTGEFRFGAPHGHCFSTRIFDGGSVIANYNGEYGEIGQDWGFIEGEVSVVDFGHFRNYKSMRLYGNYPHKHYQGYMEDSKGAKFIGSFNFRTLGFYGTGYLIDEDILLKSEWDDEGREVEDDAYQVSMNIDNHKRAVVCAFERRSSEPPYRSRDDFLEDSVAKIDFVLQHFKLVWPPHLPGNEIQLYDETLHDEFRILRSRITELIEDIKTTEFSVKLDENGDLIKEKADDIDAVNNHNAGRSEISSEEFDEYFEWPSTDAEPSWYGIDDVDVDSWPKVGVLKMLGYSVGERGGVASQSVRSNLLDKAFLSSRLPFVKSYDHMKEWGPANSCTRLKKIANVLATISVREKRNGWKVPSGRRDEDLEYLKSKYYDNSPCSRNFDWPSTDI